jgi:hypothetical protein
MEHAETRWCVSESKQETARFSAFLQHPKNLLPLVTEMQVFWSTFCSFAKTVIFRICQSVIKYVPDFGLSQWRVQASFPAACPTTSNWTPGHCYCPLVNLRLPEAVTVTSFPNLDRSDGDGV